MLLVVSRANQSTRRADVGAALYGLVTGAVRRTPREMSLTSASTLSTLARTGPRRVTDLAVIEGVSQPAMTVLIRVLEEAGMVERRADPSDKRVAIVAVTKTGSSYVHARRREGADAFVELIEKLTDAEVASLVAAIPALERLRELDGEDRERPIRSTRRQAGASR